MASDAEHDRLRELIRYHDRRGEPASARAVAEKLVAAFPKSSLAHLDLGIALIDLAQYEAASEAIRKCERTCPPELLHHPQVWKGHLYEAQWQLRRAEKCYRKVIERNPKYAEGWAYLGSNLAKQARFKEAKAVWRKHIRLGTGATEEGHLNLGLILRSEKRFKHALTQADKALQIDPGYVRAKQLRSDLLSAMKM